MKRAIVVLCCGVLLGGCIDTIRVYDAGGHRQDGVPFFPKVTKWKQVTTYVDRWMDVTLKKIQVDSNDPAKPVEKDVWSLTRHAHGKAEQVKVDAFITALLENAPTDGAIETAFQAMDSKPFPDLDGASKKENEYSNAVTAAQVPDYDRQMYVNAPLPWFGSSNFSATLASDGTLTSTTSNVSTGLTDALDKLTPTKDLLSAIAKPLIAAIPTTFKALDRNLVPKKGGPANITFRYAVVFTEWAYQFDVTATFGAEQHPWTPLPLTASAAYTVRDTRDKPEPKDDPTVNTIKVNGTIGIPK